VAVGGIGGRRRPAEGQEQARGGVGGGGSGGVGLGGGQADGRGAALRRRLLAAVLRSLLLSGAALALGRRRGGARGVGIGDRGPHELDGGRRAAHVRLGLGARGEALVLRLLEARDLPLCRLPVRVDARRVAVPDRVEPGRAGGRDRPRGREEGLGLRQGGEGLVCCAEGISGCEGWLDIAYRRRPCAPLLGPGSRPRCGRCPGRGPRGRRRTWTRPRHACVCSSRPCL
jgi:hypothetical protein